MKYYLLTDSDFELLLTKLKNEKYEGSTYVRTEIAVEAGKIASEIRTGKANHQLDPDRISERLTKFAMDEMHRHFHYHVYSWAQEMKK